MSKISSLLKKWSDSSLVLRILIGLVIGAVLGLLCPQWTGIGILGQVFVSALKAIAPVLVALLVASSIAKGRSSRCIWYPRSAPRYSRWWRVSCFR